MKYGKREQSSPETAAGPHPHPLELEMWSFCWIVVVVRVNINIIRGAFRWQTLAPLRAYVRLSFGMRRQGRRLLLLLRCNKPVEAKKKTCPCLTHYRASTNQYPYQCDFKKDLGFQRPIPEIDPRPPKSRCLQGCGEFPFFFMNPPDRKRTVFSW